MSAGCLRVVTFDLDDFLNKVGSWNELRYDVAVETVDEYGVFQRLVLRIYGIDASNTIIVYEDVRVLRRFGDEERLKAAMAEAKAALVLYEAVKAGVVKLQADRCKEVLMQLDGTVLCGKGGLELEVLWPREAESNGIQGGGG